MSRQHHDPEIAAQLDALYARLPVVHCKGLCVDSCGPIVQFGSMTEQELLRLQDAGGLRTGRMRRRPEACPYLNAEGRCDVYEVRPIICRLWGAVDVEWMSCPHGCEVEGGMLSDAGGKQFLALATVSGGYLQDSVLYGRGRFRRDDEIDRIRLVDTPSDRP